MTRRKSAVEVKELDRGRHEVRAAFIIRVCVINENHSSCILLLLLYYGLLLY